MDDAAIYQASARNSKGIVSCSGVLEVGFMSEFNIHQRFFAKLKQKADLKKREIEESRHQEKENFQQEQLGINDFRSIRLPTEHQELESLSVQDGETTAMQHEKLALKNTKAPKEEINGVLEQPSLYNDIQQKGSDLSQDNDRQLVSALCQEIGNQQLNLVKQRSYDQEVISICEQAENVTTQLKEKANKKSISISNGFDEALSLKSTQVAGKGTDTHESMSLAKIQVNSFQTQSHEEPQKKLEKSQQLMNASKNQAKEHERNIEKLKAEETEHSHERYREHKQERSRNGEKDSRTFINYEHKTITISDAKVPLKDKEPDHQHKSALSSVFHSLKDILFGKSKKDTDSKNLNAEKETLVTDSETDLHILRIQPQKTENTSVVVSEEDKLRNGEPSENKQLIQETPPLVRINPESVNLKLDDTSLVSTNNNTEQLSETLVSVDTKKKIYPESEQINKEEKENSDSWTKTISSASFEVSVFPLFPYNNMM